MKRFTPRGDGNGAGNGAAPSVREFGDSEGAPAAGLLGAPSSHLLLPVANKNELWSCCVNTPLLAAI